MSSKSKVYFFFDGVKANLKNRKELKALIESIFKKEKTSLERLNYIFCSDEKLLSINNQYLSHDYYTDIITFQLTNGKEPIIGEAYISLDRVRDNAKNIHTPIIRELQRVIIHGALHLCGYKDKKPGDIKKMRIREDHYLSKLS